MELSLRTYNLGLITLEVPGDVDYGDALIASDQQEEFQDLGALVVEWGLPPVFDYEFGDEDGDLSFGVVVLDLEDVVDQREEDEAEG